MRIKGIKDQTMILLVGMSVGITLVFSLLAVITAFVVEDSVISNFIDQQAALIEKHHAQRTERTLLLADSVKVFRDIQSTPQWAQQHIHPAKVRGEIFTADNTHYHYRKLNIGASDPSYLIMEVSDLLVVTHQPRIPIVFLTTFLVVLLLAIFIAIRFSKKIVDPILTLTNAVKLNEQFETAAPLPKLTHELGYLSDAMQDSVDKLSAALEREKYFATNVSHELRTPLTVLKNSCVLIAQRGFTVDDLTQISQASAQMENTVNVLLSLARAEYLEPQKCNIISALEQVILRCHTPELAHFKIEIDIPHDINVKANSHLLSLLLENLFRNAVQHASEPIIRILFIDRKLVFENKTTQAPKPDINKAGIKGDDSEGVGQGLYLVARIAERLGWEVSVISAQLQFRVIINIL